MRTHPNIIDCMVLTGCGTDIVMVSYDAPKPIRPFTDRLTMKFEATAGTGVNYVKNVLGLSDDEIEVVKV